MTDILKIHTITVKRVSFTQGASGGPVPSWDTANRDGRPIKIIGRAIRLSEKEMIDHGVRGDIVVWKFLIPDTDPKVDLNDQVTFEYLPGDSTTSHTVKVTKASFLRSNESEKLYKFMGQEDTTES